MLNSQDSARSVNQDPADRLRELVNSFVKNQKIGMFKAADILSMAQVALGFHPVEIVIKYLQDEPEKAEAAAISLIKNIADIFGLNVVFTEKETC